MTIATGQSLVFAILAPLGREVHLGELEITSIIALSALVFAISAPLWGRLSDRVGRKPIIITGLIGYTIGTVIFTSVFYAGLTGALVGISLYLFLLIVRCSQSLVMSATNPATAAYAADHTSPEERTGAMARLGTANSLGTILGPAVGAALATFGLLAPLYFAAVMAAVAALLVWQVLPMTPAIERSAHPANTRLKLADPRIVVYVMTTTGIFIGFSGIQQTLGFQLQDKLGLDGIQTAQLTGAALMVTATFNFLVQVTIMQRLQVQVITFIRLGLLSLCLGGLALTASDSFIVLAIGMAFLGVGLGLCVPAIAAGASMAVTPREQGGAAGLVAACTAIGFVAGPLCAGALYQVDGLYASLFSAIIFAAVFAAVQMHKTRA
ncbi:MAG: MFS transporter [Pseudomonadota bacterium]